MTKTDLIKLLLDYEKALRVYMEKLESIGLDDCGFFDNFPETTEIVLDLLDVPRKSENFSRELLDEHIFRYLDKDITFSVMLENIDLDFQLYKKNKDKPNFYYPDRYKDQDKKNDLFK